MESMLKVLGVYAKALTTVRDFKERLYLVSRERETDRGFCVFQRVLVLTAYVESFVKCICELLLSLLLVVTALFH